MIAFPAGMQVMVATQPIDFRKGADGLMALVRERLAQDPCCGTIFVFRSKRADRIKILAWDGSGLVLLWKRLEQGAFRWPPVTDGVMKLTSANSPHWSTEWIGRACTLAKWHDRQQRRERCDVLNHAACRIPQRFANLFECRV